MCKGPDGADVNVYWGSETGTAEFFSEQLTEFLNGHGISSTACSLMEFDPKVFVKHRVVLMVVATYGEGGPTADAEKFYRWMRSKRTEAGCLSSTSFSVMGLGDMNYSSFNKMGEDTDAHLLRLGGKKIYKRGVGDACQDIEEHFQKWKDGGLIEAVKAALENSGAPDLAPAAAAATPAAEPAAEPAAAPATAPAAA